MSTFANVMRVPCGCKAVLSEWDPRAPIWKASLGKLEFPLLSPMQHVGQAESEHPDLFLKGDWEAISQEQQQRMCQEMKKKFGIDDAAFLAQIKALGYMPIKDKNITVIVCQNHTRMMIC